MRADFLNICDGDIQILRGALVPVMLARGNFTSKCQLDQITIYQPKLLDAARGNIKDFMAFLMSGVE